MFAIVSKTNKQTKTHDYPVDLLISTRTSDVIYLKTMFRANNVICRYIIYVTVIRMVLAQYNGCLISGRHIPERLTDDQKRI